MDIKTKKLHFVQEFLKINDESIIDKLDKTLKTERTKFLKKKIKPLNNKEFNNLIDQAESDSENERITSTTDLIKEIDSWS